MATQDIDLGVVARGDKGDKGDKGDVGPTGPAPTLTVGSVTKLSPSQSPTVSLSGSNGTYSMSFGIPQGATGETNATATNALNVANSVDSKVTAIQANGGGRNLLIGSDPTLGDIPSLGGTREVNIDGVKAWESNNADNIFFDISLEANTTYTYSASIKADDAGELGFLRYGHFQVKNPNAHNQADPTHEDVAEKRDYHGIAVPANQWTRIYYTFTTNDLSGSKFGVFPSHSDGHVYIRHLMLEKGTVAHEWQPAPEDIQTQIDANKTAAANAQTSANNAQNTANSAQSTANTAIKVSETLKDLGNYTATASGTTANSPTTGLPRTSGVSMSEVYDNGYPTTYGNVLNVAGAGAGQLLLGWSGNDNTTEHLWYRSHRDTSTGGWGTWQKIAYVSDLTWSNISGKPDVATKSDVSSALTVANTAKSTADSALSKANSNATALSNKVSKSDLTWANISGKPSIPDDDATTTVSSGDLNNCTTTGKYYMPNALSNYTNHPTTGTDMGDWFVMKVDAYHSSDMIVQTIYQINSGDVWIRQRWSGAWKSWRQINFWS